MRIPIASNNDSMLLALTLKANNPAPIRIRVADAFKQNTLYTDRETVLQGKKTFYIRMPRTGKLILADIFNTKSGAKPVDNDPNITLVKKEIFDLPTFRKTYKSNELVDCAFAFIQDFAENAGWYSAGATGSVYRSNCNRFRIDYLDVIRDRREKIPKSRQEPNIMVPNPNFNKELTTPARISQDRGIIEVSKKYYLPKPVPERVAILAHEVGHYFINDDQHDEEEADENAIAQFLGRGYGFIDAENGFLNVFKNADTPQNRERYAKLHKQIEDFEKQHNTFR
jgi:hypothetical protein